MICPDKIGSDVNSFGRRGTIVYKNSQGVKVPTGNLQGTFKGKLQQNLVIVKFQISQNSWREG